MYRIVQALNNNVALVKDKYGEQAVVMGLGITYKKSKGDLIVSDKIEKVFSLKSSESKENFLTLLRDVPLDFITVTYDVIDSLSSKYHYPVQEYLYVTLTDHIYCSYKAILDNTYQKSDIRQLSQEYQEEYQMATEALAIFRSKLLADFPDDEIGKIALHFINAKSLKVDDKKLKVRTAKTILEQVQKILEQYDIKRTKTNVNFYDRLMVHLTYFIEYLDRSRDDNLSLLEMEDQIKQTYPRAYQIADEIYRIIIIETGVDSYPSERFYIALHIQRLL
ncbi:PRD domain-containing protein [Streptococcus downei]|uniref:Beta-glucoside bgl operon antiterminator, BglG family n=1 Tax=Streptococcus downei MFe28 TaxID=764290 RepID=A0A380JGE6_STRDO|nr:PRD domain-containing protein [Streptococcus downei]SUN36126.1 Beta-glucoside bgl operon antiterminator, BglG family [Streptococcus downei MFe28]